MDSLNPQAPDAATGYAPQTLGAALERIAHVQATLASKNLTHRDPPPPPTSCCGRGCNGCVWEGYFAAVSYWMEQADALIGQ